MVNFSFVPASWIWWLYCILRFTFKYLPISFGLFKWHWGITKAPSPQWNHNLSTLRLENKLLCYSQGSERGTSAQILSTTNFRLYSNISRILLLYKTWGYYDKLTNLYEIFGGMLLICQVTTVPVHGAWIKICYVLRSKTYGNLL